MGEDIGVSTSNNVRVMTDDAETLKEEARYPSVQQSNFTITLPPRNIEWRTASKRDLLVDILTLLRGEPAVLDVRSNLSFLVALRKIFEALDSAQPTTIVTMTRNPFLLAWVHVNSSDVSPLGMEIFPQRCPDMQAHTPYSIQRTFDGPCTG